MLRLVADWVVASWPDGQQATQRRSRFCASGCATSSTESGGCNNANPARAGWSTRPQLDKLIPAARRPSRTRQYHGKWPNLTPGQRDRSRTVVLAHYQDRRTEAKAGRAKARTEYEAAVYGSITCAISDAIMLSAADPAVKNAAEEARITRLFDIKREPKH